VAKRKSGFRQKLIDTALAMNSAGLNQGTSGNISVRSDKGFLITPSALAYAACMPADIVFTAMDGSFDESGRRPSSEWRLHRDIYSRFSEAGAVLHAHPPWCTTLACLDKTIPAFHYMIALAGGDSIPCAEYALFGTEELSKKVVKVLKNRTACLMSHHGMICYADDLEKILALAVEVENLARVYAQLLQLGTPDLLNKQQMKEVLQRFVSYQNGNV